MKRHVEVHEAPEIADGEAREGFGALETAAGALPLERMEVEARVAGLAVAARVVQTFANRTDGPLEATYVFPLPPESAVTALSARIGGRTVTGELRERGEARDDYEAAVAEGRAAAIAEQERTDVFTLRVGNIAPGERVEVELRLAGLLDVDGGEATYRFPLVVAPRYVPGRAFDGPQVGDGTALDTDAAPDASRISPPVLLPGHRAGVRLAIRVQILDERGAIARVRSSLHGVRVSRDGSWLGIELIPDGRLDRDFVLRWAFDDEVSAGITAGLTLVPDAPDPTRGTWLLHLAAAPRDGRSARARDVVFLLDRSGSMAGWKMVAARRATAEMIGTLTGDDRFAVFAFDDSLERLGPTAAGEGDLVAATASARSRVAGEVRRLQERGGTEMARAIERGFDALRRAGERERVVVLITDGQVANEDQLFELAVDRMAGAAVKVLCVGIDQAVNAGLLQRLASWSGGRVELVENEARLGVALRRLHRHLTASLLQDVKITLDGGVAAVAEETTPSPPIELFETAPLTAAGRYERTGAAGTPRALVSAGTPDGKAWRAEVAATEVDAPDLRRIWAKLRLRDLEDRWALAPDDGLERQMIDLSVEHRVLCRFTAWVAIDRDAEVEPVSGRPRRVVQPVEYPAGWSRGLGVASTGARASSFAGAFGAGDAGGVQTAALARTQAGVVRGGFASMAPEQVRGEPVGWRADVFSLGVLLWEMVEGRRLYGGRTDFEVLQACAEGRLPDPLITRAGAARFEPPLRAMLSLDPAARPTLAVLPSELEDLERERRAAGDEDLAVALDRLLDAGVRRALERAASRRAEIPSLGDDDLALLEKMGAGETTETWLAVAALDGGPEVVVAKKLLPWVAEEPDAAEGFMSPLRLHHENLVEVVGVVVGRDGSVFQLQRWVPAVDLEWVLSRTRRGLELSLANTARIGADVAAGLAALAAAAPAGSHRQVEASNVRVTLEGRAVLAGGPADPASGQQALRRVRVLEPGQALTGRPRRGWRERLRFWARS